MPLQPGDRRISTTYNPDNSYLTPDVHLLKQSDPIAAHELARILDTLGRHAYRGVVWVGQVNPADYFLDESANPIAGFIGAPFNTLNDGYVAALSRFGTPSSGNPVAVIVIGANTVETAPVQLCSSYVNILGAGENFITGAAGQPVFSSCAASGMTVSGLNLIANNAPVLYVSPTEPLIEGITFENCVLTNVGAAPSSVEGLLDIHNVLEEPIILDGCLVQLNNRPLLYFDPNTNPNQLTVDIKATSIVVNPGVSTVLQGLVYLGARLTNVDITLAQDNASLFSCYSNGGSSYLEVSTLKIRNDSTTAVRPFKIIDTIRYNTVYWEEIQSDANLILNVSAFVDATLTGEILNSRFFKMSLASATMKLDNLRIVNVVGDLMFNVTSVNQSVELVNIRTVSPLASVTDTTAFITSNGAVAPKIFNCDLSYRLFYTAGAGVFCGTVIGGTSYGITRVLCLSNPTRQCILRGHSLLKQEFYTNNVLSSTFYPDLLFAGVTLNDCNVPILIQDVDSQGIIDAEVPDLTLTPGRYAYISNSTFTAHDLVTETDANVQPWFPSIPVALNPPADQRIFISGGARMPIEDSNDRDIGIRSWTYVQRIANRFGPLYLGDPSQPTVIEGNTFSVSNPRALRQALNINYTTLYVRLCGGQTYVDLISPNFNSWTVLSMVSEAGLDSPHLKAVSSNLPMVYTYFTTPAGDHTLRLSVSEPILAVDHVDFVVSSLNSQEDAATALPVGTLDVTQVGSLPIPLGVTTFPVTFSPAFTTLPIVIPGLEIPASAPSIQVIINAVSVNNTGFTVTLPGGALTLAGYVFNYFAATINA